VEVFHAPHCNDPAWVEVVRKRLDASPVNINSVHAPFSKEVDISRLDDGGQEFSLQQVSNAIIVAKRLGAGFVVVHGSSEPIEDSEREKRINQCKDSLSILGERAEKAGVRIALELLPRTCLGNTADELQVMIDHVPPEQVGFCLDANHPKDHTRLTGIVKQLGDRIITLHISDYDGIDEKHWLPFEGVIDWGNFANALRDIDYRGAFVYETKAEDDIDGRLENIYSNFQRILNAASGK